MMSAIFLFFITLCQLQTLIHSELLEAPSLKPNSYIESQNDVNTIFGINDYNNENEIDDDMPSIKTGRDQAEIAFPQPINSVNIDYSKNSIVLKFRKPYFQNVPKEENSYLGTDFMRLGKRAYEKAPEENSFIHNNQKATTGGRFERSSENFNKIGEVGLRDSRGDNFMRFGRNPSDFMRLGRASADFMRLGRNPGPDFMRFGRSPKEDFMRFGRRANDDFMRFGRSPGEDFMRFGRNPGEDFMRFGRSAGQDFMRFGRNPGQDFMRFGRSAGQDFMRLGRNPGQDFMRLGRSPGQDFMRLGRNPGQDFMRLGRNPGEDFMRFGRSPGQDFMRFGRNSADFLRFGRSGDKNAGGNEMDFMRFGRPENFMRFGRSKSENLTDRLSKTFEDIKEANEKDSNHTSPAKEQKNEIKAVAKMIHDSKTSINDDSNPMDKAIQVLFNKQNNQDNELTKAEVDVDLSMEQEYKR